RLLGIAANYIGDGSAARQTDLFDFGEANRRKVEEAILRHQEKDPAAKITKARMMGESRRPAHKNRPDIL
ncbi:MAG: hypothetical protein K2I74_04635, partial [Treponemataceae bacterium]|nr:hypothetical protein [Treponemataceae bacterium]